LPFDSAGYERAHQPIEKYFSRSRSAARYCLCVSDCEHGFSWRGRVFLNARLFSRLGSRGEKPKL